MDSNRGYDFVSLPNRIKCYLTHVVNPPVPGTTYGTFISDVGEWSEIDRWIRFTCETPGWNVNLVLSVLGKTDPNHHVALYWWIQIHDSGVLKYEGFINQQAWWEGPYFGLFGWIRYPTPFPFPHDVYAEFDALPYSEE